MELINITQYSDWLKNTIPGIIILGGIGSIIGAFFIWFGIKIFTIFTTLINKSIGQAIYKLLFLYIKHYFIFRGTIHQLKNKNSDLSLSIIHNKFISNRNLMIIISVIFFITSYLLLLLTNVTYSKTAIFFIAITITTIHDAIMFSVPVHIIQKLLFGSEEEFSKKTYSQKDILELEFLLFAKEFKK